LSSTLYNKSVVTGVLITLFMGLSFQLINLQIIQRSKYLAHSNQNRIRRLRLEAPRGILYDRNGVVLLENQPSYSLSAVPHEVNDNQKVLQFLSQVLLEPVEKIKVQLKETDNPFFPVKLRRDIDYDILVRLEERKLDLPGVVYEIETKRVYPAGVKAPHLFGYTGEISRNELERRKSEGLLQGDLVGKNGLEKVYDHDLRGAPGYDFIEVDVIGREVRDIVGEGESLPVRGKDFYLTIDVRLQVLGDSLLYGKRGAIVMLDVRDGGLLAICSKPDYDPEIFSGVMSNETWQALVNDPAKPLFDRVTQSTYPPGSTLKMVAVAAAIDEHKCGPDHMVVCHGGVTFGNKTFSCHGGKGHGALGMVDALKVSCNSYFYNLGLMIGVDAWAEAAAEFGFGDITGIDLPNEEKGILPDRRYLDRVFGPKGWSNGMMLNLAIGQGDLVVTPLQAAQYVMMIANRGWCFKPHLVQKLYDPLLRQMFKQRIPKKESHGIFPEAFDIIHEGMYRVVNEEGGTGRASRLEDVKVCGKTGTAQNPHGEAHAWYVGFAPAQNPEVAICVLLENAGGGGANSAPLAGQMFKRYFGNKKLPLTKDISADAHKIAMR
jgi:penicillin-binding protein 2